MSRKGDKGGPDGGDDMEGGPDGLDGPEGLPGMGPGVGPGMGPGGPRPPHMMQGGPLSSGGNGPNNGPGMPNSNMHHLPHGAHNNHNVHNNHGPHGGPHNNHGVHGVHNAHNTHGPHGGMQHKIATNTSYLSSGNLGGDHNSHNAHGAGGLSSSMMGIKTEMKYSGSAHSHSLQQSSHLQQQSHQQQHGHAGHNMHASHNLPSIPRMDNVYNPAGGASNSVGGPHLSGVRPGMVGSLSASSSSGAGGHHPHGPPHNLLSQAQQQKLQQQQALAQNALQQHHLQQQALLQQQQQAQQAQAKLQPHSAPPLGQGGLSGQTLQSTGPALQASQTAQGGQMGSLHVPLQVPGQSMQGVQAVQNVPASLTPQTLAPAHPHVPSGLLLSGPSAAHLHSTGSTANSSTTPHGLAALPSVASHSSSTAAPAPGPAPASASLTPPNFSAAPPRQG